jgi:putative hydrolase of the HAD superfamily
MNRPHLIIFDGDDTLWNTQFLYDEAKSAIDGLLEEAGLSSRNWRRNYGQIDAMNLQELKFHRSRFPKSCAQAYVATARDADQPADPDLKAAVTRIAASVFTQRAQVDADAADVLSTLRMEHVVALLTQGDPQVQSERIQVSGLKDLFDSISVVEEKDEAVFREVAAAHSMSGSRSWSVGNSLANDVNPALRCGMRGILLQKRTWAYADREKTPAGECFRVSRLREIPPLLEKENIGA